MADLVLVRDLAEVPGTLARLARAGDLVITLGAGSIGGVADRIVAALEKAPVADVAAGGSR